MAASGPSWLVDKRRIATKIKCASEATEKVIWESNPTRACPNCQHVIDNSDVTQEWPGLPRGVKFDPSDQEIIWHLLAKVGEGSLEPHPFIDEFITTLKMDDGICYTHPQRLPGVSRDGIASHFFHRAIKAYNTGSRKRRKICGQDFGDVRWHKTGRTKPILLNGLQKGCKKIMVLYMTPESGGKAEKTNWVMHQYHLGTEEDEKDGEYVISKVFYQQQQQAKLGEKDDQNVPETSEATVIKVDPVTPNSVTPEPPRNEKQCSDVDQEQESHHSPQILPDLSRLEWLLESQDDCEELPKIDSSTIETQTNEGVDNIDLSQNLLNSQQLAEGLSLFADFFQSQSPKRDGENGEQMERPSLSVYAHLGAEQLKKDIEECQNLELNTTKKNDIEECLNLDADTEKKSDIEECQNLNLDTANVELDSQPSDIRLSQLEFSSQDSYIAWGGYKTIN